MLINEYSAGLIASKIAAILLCVCMALLVYTRLFVVYYEISILLFVFIGLLGKFVSEVYVNNDGSMSTALIPLATFILFNVGTYKMFVLNIVFLVGYLIRILLKYKNESDTEQAIVLLLDYWVLLIGIFCISAYIGYLI